MNLKELQFNDIVSLSQPKFAEIDLGKYSNLFHIESIENDKIHLEGLDKSFNISQIQSVQIDRELDNDIYFDMISAAAIIPFGKPTPITKNPKEFCYLNMIIENETCIKIAKRLGITEVHIFQHYLLNKHKSFILKIKYHEFRVFKYNYEQ